MSTETIQTLHFKVGEGINDIVRTAYWFEGKKEWAHSVLDCMMGITEDQKKAILQGEMRLTPIEDGERMDLVDEPEEFTKQFKKEVENFIRIQENKKYDATRYVQPEKCMMIGTGWLMPNGEFFKCGYMQHINTAEDIYRREKLIETKEDDSYTYGFNCERWVEQQGAIKITDGKIIFGSDTITQEQLDTLSEYLDKGGKIRHLSTEFIYVKQMVKCLREFANLKRRAMKKKSD